MVGMNAARTTSDNTLECGHTSDRDSVSLPGVGEICRDCHTPFPLRKWENTLRTTKAHHTTGETTLYRTWLIGLDRFGRAVYHDEYNGTILKLVPKHHRAFEADVDGDERIIRTHPPKHGGGRGKPVNAPNNDVLVAADRINTPSREFGKQDLVEYVTKHAHTEMWDDLSEAAIDLLKRYSKTSSRGEIPHLESVLKKYSDDNED